MEQYREIWARQGGRCPICLRPIPVEFLTRAELAEAETRPHVDHDHATDEVRGILCGACNQALGMLQDDAERMHRAIAYLRDTPRIPMQRVAALPNGLKTHCPQNHPYDEANTYIETDGTRRCKQCRRDYEARRAAGKQHFCSDCGASISDRGIRCVNCAAKRRWESKDRANYACVDCGGAVSRKDVQRCRPCEFAHRRALARS